MNAQMNFDMNANMNANMKTDMDTDMKFTNEDKQQMGIAENCNVSAYSLFTFAGGILLAIGAVVYSLIAM